ncbi:MAG: YdbL family protein [Rickettsiales bacterium]|nr:YdbL family protein [Rickettsiales bacterium]
MNITRYIAVIVLALSISSTAHALDLQTAKSKGLIGEMHTGYLGVVEANKEVEALVADINAKRKAAYQKISNENGQPLHVVESLAAKKLYNKLKPSEYFMPDGSKDWQKK